MLDFTNRQNRFVRLNEVSQEYLDTIKQMTKTDCYYPTYHIAPHHGLINDPNGLCFYNDEHHIFYQWFPLGPVHGLKHWYHVSTKDFVHFTDHGIAMYPDKSYDSHGCYSGSAFNLDEKLYLLYTGNQMIEEGVFEQTQCLAIMDKAQNISKKGVLVTRDQSLFTENLRDPVVFKRDEDLCMLVGAENIHNQGELALYKGKSFETLTYAGAIDIGIQNFGYMWECPNYFEQGEQGVLIFSPQGISSSNKYDFKNVFSVVYFIGDKINVENRMFYNNGYVELDKGFDFYAPQTYEDNKGRRILLGWLGNSKSTYPTDKNMWAHMLTIPRELEIKNSKLYQKPIEELTNLRVSSYILENSNDLISGAFEIECEVEKEFMIKIQNAHGENISFSSNGKEYCLDRGGMSELYAEQFGTRRYAIHHKQEPQKIRLFVDQSSIEIFCDDGQTVFTSRFFIKEMTRLLVEGATGKLHYLSGIKVSK